MSILNELNPNTSIYDRHTGQYLMVDKVEPAGQVVFLSLRNPTSGEVKRSPFPVRELDSRFELAPTGSAAFNGGPALVSLLAELYRIRHAYLFNPLFATETSLIDLLPHQMAAVYGVPANDSQPARPGMVDQPRLRFLLADDAGAGKTIMAGLLIREMLLRRQARRILVVPPAGLVGNWERELRVLFRLRFRVLSGSEFKNDDNPFTDPRNVLAIISVDTLWRERVREAYLSAPPYDLVAFDEAHKLSAWRNADLTEEKSRRYAMAEHIARQQRHLLLMTATPHMGKDDPYYFLWRLLEPQLLSTQGAFNNLTTAQKQRYLLRRMKEEMVYFDGRKIFVERASHTIEYELRPEEYNLYQQVTHYCETEFDRARRLNRSAAGLAMSILQRRLASSTWALYQSLARREEKLKGYLEALESGQATEADLWGQQAGLPVRDIRDTTTGDEEEGDEAETQDEAVAGATSAQTLEDLRAELAEVSRLKKLARQVYDQQLESKFERLWQALSDYPNTKVLIFTEFRDTLDFLVGRLEGRGLTGKIARIHGGLDYKEREKQADFFRRVDGARVMVATDAAGEGINLQFCWLLVNYDIPWNPARLEQRMGRVHRYKQTEPVVLLNLVSKDTREGRVLKVLLDKLELIRKELGSDKVFDIIGQRFTGKPLSELIFEAVVQGKEAETRQAIEQTLTPEQTREFLEAQARKVEISQVRALLAALVEEQQKAELKRMMPAYIRSFFQEAIELVGAGIKGDIAGLFHLDPCPVELQQAVATYPEAIRERLTFDRELAKPDLTRDPQAIFLHPGEVVFDTVADLMAGQYDHEGLRGATFYDGNVTEPYLFYLVKSLVKRDLPVGTAGEPEVITETVTGVRRYAGERFELLPAHWLLTLLDEADTPTDSGEILRKLAGDITPVEAFVLEQIGLPAYEKQRQEEENRLPQQRSNLTVAFNLRRVELMKQKRLLKDAVEKGVPAAETHLRRCEAELSRIDQERRETEAELYSRTQRLGLGPVTILVQALVLPLSPEEAELRHSARTERIALEEVERRERAAGAIEIKDVSNPQLQSGFDLRITYADGSVRFVEVKGTSGQAAVEMKANEWRQAANHPDRYWLYVVYHCDTVPQLHRIPDPFGRLIGKATGSVRINVSDILKAAKQETTP
ncbi:MAG: RNA polymerase-associated protein RapA [Anaerolineae bacterium]|nr:RNA polymerase-associated protein RapA [Anaerolineae bacterium]